MADSEEERVGKRGETFRRDDRGTKSVDGQSSQSRRDVTTAEYCERLRAWMWQYHCACEHWHSWMSASAFSLPPCFSSPGVAAHSSNGFAVLPSRVPTVGEAAEVFRPAGDSAPAQHHLQDGDAQHHLQDGDAQRPGREYSIPSPLQRFLAEMVDFFILFFIKATIILSIMHLSGMKDITKFALHFIVEEINEDTSMEDMQKMMLVALVYRILVCFYEIICIWGAGGATPGKFLIGLQVVACDTSVLVQPNRVRVVPANNISLSASAVRALNKNFSIAFFFPAFITLLFFQHNRTVYDIVAGTIVVKRTRPR